MQFVKDSSINKRKRIILVLGNRSIFTELGGSKK